MIRSLCLFASALALSETASAQLVVTMALNGTSAVTEHYVIDLTTGVSTQLFPGFTPANGDPQLAGAAADDANRILYFSANPTSPSGQDVIYSWPYGDANDPVEAVVNPVDTTGNPIDCSGLAFGNGSLYALNQFAGAAGDGIFEIDLATGVGTLVMPITGLDVGGIAFNPSDGLFYGTSDIAAARGIYSFDIATQTQALVAAYPANVADVDGCAVDPSGAGVVYLIEDNPAPLHAYDLQTGTYLTTPMSPVVGTFTYSGATWAASYFGGTAIGANFCSPTPNSTGAPGDLSAVGSTAVADNNVTLNISTLPPSQFGIVVVGEASGSGVTPPGSQGVLCLTGAVGRYSLPGEIFQLDSSGAASFSIDVTAIRRPASNVAAAPGDTWLFQAWHRDVPPMPGTPGSNFTNGVEITFN